MKAFHSFSPRMQFLAVVVMSALSIVFLGLVLQTGLTPNDQPEKPPPAAVMPSSPPPAPRRELDRPGEGLVAIPGSDPAPTRPEALSPPQPRTAPAPEVQNPSYYGHLPYAQNDQSLVDVGQYVRDSYRRTEYLDIEAAYAFLEMQTNARLSGVALMPISGFRTLADQEALFARQVARQGSEAAAAQLSAPPGYSEHHTGFAIDLADETQPDTDLKFAFETTTAYEWLIQHAKDYGFELSFPPDNPQGVSFEPWHWRFVGSQRAMATFRQAMRL